jgi:hypothetical protein
MIKMKSVKGTWAARNDSLNGDPIKNDAQKCKLLRL